MLWFFYIAELVIVFFTVCLIMVQKSSDSVFSSAKVFGIRGRSNAIIKLTYFLLFLFVVNTSILYVIYNNKHKKEMIQFQVDEKQADEKQADEKQADEKKFAKRY